MNLGPHKRCSTLEDAGGFILSPRLRNEVRTMRHQAATRLQAQAIFDAQINALRPRWLRALMGCRARFGRSVRLVSGARKVPYPKEHGPNPYPHDSVAGARWEFGRSVRDVARPHPFVVAFRKFQSRSER